MTALQLGKLMTCCNIQRRTTWEHALLKDRLDAILSYGPTRARLTRKQEAALDSMLSGKPVMEPLEDALSGPAGGA